MLKGGQPSFEAVCGMPFTTAVLNETLRYPSFLPTSFSSFLSFFLSFFLSLPLSLNLYIFVALAPFAGRYSNENEKIGDIVVPKGV